MAVDELNHSRQPFNADRAADEVSSGILPLSISLSLSVRTGLQDATVRTIRVYVILTVR